MTVLAPLAPGDRAQLLGKAEPRFSALRFELAAFLLIVATFAAVLLKDLVVDREFAITPATVSRYERYWYADNSGTGTSTVTPDAKDPLAWHCLLTPVFPNPYCGSGIMIDVGHRGAGRDFSAQEKATLDFNLTGLDLETIAGKMIEVGTDTKPAQPDALKAALMPLLLAGQPKLAFGQSLTAPAFDVKGQGETSLLPAQQGKATVSASNLDEIAAALGKAGASDPGPQRAAMGIAFLKGLAKTGPDGRLTWDIDFDSLARKVTVNGQSFGPGAQK